jgi:hypothetical protein
MGDPWPDINIMQMLNHYKEMASFVVKVLATSACDKELFIQIMDSRTFGGNI